jgi:hypothetical protein
MDLVNDEHLFQYINTEINTEEIDLHDDAIDNILSQGNIAHQHKKSNWNARTTVFDDIHRLSFNCRDTVYKKGFIRFELYDDGADNLEQILDSISKVTVQWSIYNVKYVINLGLNMVLMKEYGREINLINVEQILNYYTEENLDSSIYKKIDGGSIINHKYIFDKRAKFYLDIPLLEEFYTPNQIGVFDSYHNIIYKVNVKSLDHKYLYLLKKYLIV